MHVQIRLDPVGAHQSTNPPGLVRVELNVISTIHQNPNFFLQEAVFEHSVRQNVYEERQNQLRWQVRLGEDQITNADRANVIAARNEAWDRYKVNNSKMHLFYLKTDGFWPAQTKNIISNVHVGFALHIINE